MKVLLASDGSEQSFEAAKFLRRFVSADPLHVTAIFCHYMPGVYFNELSVDLPQLERDYITIYTDQIRRRLEEVFCDSKTQINVVVQEGHAGHAVGVYAEKNNFDLITMGAKGHSAWSRAFVGSVSDFVATHAHCSVLVVRSLPICDQATWVPTVSIGYDGSLQSKAAIDDLSRIRSGGKANVHLLHAENKLIPYRGIVQPSSLPSDSSKQTNTLEHLKGVAKQMPFHDPDPQVHLLESDHFGQSIVDFASRARSDLIMLGDTGKSAISQMLLGSVSRYVLSHAPMSVWIAKCKDKNRPEQAF